MGVGDFVDKAKDMAAENKDKVKEGIDKAGDTIDEKTGGEHAEHVDKGQEAAKDYVEKLDEK
ncbi:MAG: antitoxin [Acidimicrobiia bacterium]|jgi:hypothetical protein